MLTTAPHLLIRRPSPTTAEFTVTTRPPTTLPLRLALLALVPLRLVVGGFSLLLLWSIYLLSPYALPAPSKAIDASLLSITTLLRALHNVALSPPGVLARRLAATTPLVLLLPTAVVLLWASLRRVHKTESLLVLRGLGIQTSSSSGSYLAGTATRFIPTEKIRDVLVNEAFRGFEVRHYLVVVVEGEGELVVVFSGLLPRRRIVETVWRGVRGCLWEEGGKN
ncbi:Phosphatidylinositol N-acetylglucosaminyltransferase subunit like protein [Verticillium longisporum]|uniref:Phosphatidylinositol N-acetylglucosaminyltransferase subunit like protein n=1 Tax=Verticillium longisporum TaxID=100787 RepID=A0A8I2ZSG0_VERLO|nr:Phosphatidylinositol N-acetylglucosaminyltransferase subunit like protein [Verticillium longisporum]KAG7136871.1 Phosphatidylinositol N-acetylglucosaminyltransferase subunit like protein [Verticillium longisporum]